MSPETFLYYNQTCYSGHNGPGYPGLGHDMAINIWPNPAEGIVHVAAAGPVNLSIASVDGKELLHNNHATTIDITHLPQGLYLLRIADHRTGSVIRVDKIIKK